MVPITGIEQLQRELLDEVFDETLAGEALYVKYVKDQDDSDNFYYRIERQDGHYFLSSSYYMGVDWVKDGLPIQILPKIEGVDGPVDYMKMLTEALTEPENANYLGRLLTIDFTAPPISIPGEEDILSPFLVTQFILVLKRAVKKGLRQSYYFVTENLKAKVKGRILTTKNISLNLSRGSKTDNYCRYQQYGIDSLENRLLKQALKVSSQILTQYRGGVDTLSLKQDIARINAYFRDVSNDFDLSALNLPLGTNPVFQDYLKAFDLAKLILRRKSYGLEKNAGKNHTTPPFWIDMSKLFELYLLSKLRKEYGREEILYQKEIGRRFPDYLLIPKDGVPMIIDAKYKPKYHNNPVEFADIGQVSAYSRLKGVHTLLGVGSKNTIPCLIIYAHPACPEDIERRIRTKDWKELPYYLDIAKLGIALPIKK